MGDTQREGPNPALVLTPGTPVSPQKEDKDEKKKGDDEEKGGSVPRAGKGLGRPLCRGYSPGLSAMLSPAPPQHRCRLGE